MYDQELQVHKAFIEIRDSEWRANNITFTTIIATIKSQEPTSAISRPKIDQEPIIAISTIC